MAQNYSVSEYLSDELASSSEDEKRIFLSERRAECRFKLAVRRRKISAPGTRSSSNSAHSSPARSASTSGLLLRDPASRIGPFYKLSIHSHLLSFYFLFAGFFLCFARLLFCFVYFLQCWLPRHNALFSISLLYFVVSMVR